MALGMPFPKQVSPEVTSELLCGPEFLLFKIHLGLFFLGAGREVSPKYWSSDTLLRNQFPSLLRE